MSITTPDEVVKTLSSLQDHVKTLVPGEKFSRLDEAVSTLTGQLRDLRRQSIEAAHAAPTGSDADAQQRYTVRAESVRAQAVDPSLRQGPVSYAAPEAARPGREYAASKTSERAVRLLTEHDEMGRAQPGLLDDVAPVTEWQAELQHIVTVRGLAKMARSRGTTSGGTSFGTTPAIDAALRRHLDRGPAWVRQAFADNATEGAEMIPDVTLPELYRKLEAARSVTNLFETMQMPTGGSTINPFLVTGCQPFLVGQPVAGDLDPAMIQRSQPVTSSVNAAPKTWGVTLPANRDASEDSIIEYAGMALMLLAEAIRDGKEDAWINADTNGGDTGLAGWNPRSRWSTLGHANDHRKTAIGLRHHSFDVSSSSALGTQTAAGIMAEFINLDSPHMLGELAIITSPEFYIAKLLQDTNLLTVDKIGALATLLTGQVGSIAGHPLVISEFVDKQYNTSGIYDDSTKTKTGVLIVNRSRWKNAVRRGPRVEVEVVARQHVTYTTLTERWTPRHIGQSTEKSVAWCYNADIS